MTSDSANSGFLLVERERELRVLEVARQAASAGQGRLVFVEGEAGVGKSSLVQAFTDTEPSAAVLFGCAIRWTHLAPWGRCWIWRQHWGRTFLVGLPVRLPALTCMRRWSSDWRQCQFRQS